MAKGGMSIWEQHLARRTIVHSQWQYAEWQCRHYGASLSIDCQTGGPRDEYPTAPIRVFGEYVISHVWAGLGRCCREGDSCETILRPGTFVVIPPGLPNVFGGIPGTGYQEDYVLFSGEPFDRLAAEGLLKTGVFRRRMTRFLPDIFAMMREAPPYGHFRAVLALQRLLLRLSQERRHPSRGGMAGDNLHVLLAEMAAHPEHWWTNGEMAAACHCSDSQLRRLFLQETGLLPKHYAEKVKMEEAARWLAHGLPLEDICRGLGFRDRSHFSHRFRAFFGVAPGQYVAPEEQLP